MCWIIKHLQWISDICKLFKDMQNSTFAASDPEPSKHSIFDQAEQPRSKAYSDMFGLARTKVYGVIEKNYRTSLFKDQNEG